VRIPKASLSCPIDGLWSRRLEVDVEPPFKQRDYERMVQSSEVFIEVAMIRLILRRLARGV
jgi:hypothetical protein